MSKARLRRLALAEDDEFALKRQSEQKKGEKRSELRKGEEKSDDDFSLNVRFFKNPRVFAVIAIILLLTIAFGMSWYTRTRTLELPQTREWAQSNVETYYKDTIRQQVNKQYPNLPSANKETIVSQEYQKFFGQNTAMIEKNVDELQKMIKRNFQDDSGMTYILNIDSFFFLRKVRNIVEKGTFYDRLENGVPWDDHMKAPSGLPAEDDFQSESAAYLYKAVHLLNPGVTIAGVAFYYPALIASLCVIPVFFIVRRKVGNFAGFFAAFLFAIHPVLLGRSMAGDFDNDVQNIFFPLIITWILLEMIESKSAKKKFILTTVIGVLMGLFSFAWKGGWWYLFDFILAIFLFYIGYVVVKMLVMKGVKRDILHLSRFWTKIALFVGPPLLIFVSFLVYRPAGIVVGGMYGLALFGYFLYIMVCAVKDKFAKRESPVVHGDLLNALVILVIFVVVSGLFVTLFNSFALFINGPAAPLRITAIQEAARNDYWPNVYTTVAELNTTDFSGVINNISSFGGLTAKIAVFFILAVMGVILCLVKEKIDWRDYFLLGFSVVFYIVMTRPSVLALPKFTYLALFVIPIVIGLYFLLDDETVDIQFASFLIVWFIATIYAGTKGIRFIHLLVPAFAVAIGITIGRVYHVLTDVLVSDLKVNKIVSKAVLILMLLLLLINPVRSATSMSKGSVPIFDRTWYEAMESVKADSKPDAIINSWWDFGHFFKYVADRPVTFDGAVQNSPPAHWIGRALSTDDEREAVGILRMLDCGQNEGYSLLDAELHDPIASVYLIKEIIVLEKRDAEEFLLGEGVAKSTVAAVLEKTHCSPPENYFVTSGDMVGKAGVWAHFGYWDFTKAFIYLNVKGMSHEEGVQFLEGKMNLSSDVAESTYLEIISLTDDRSANSWISPWPGVVTQNTLPCERKNETVECKLGLGIGQTAQTTTVIERAMVNLEDMNESSIVVSVFDKSMAQRLATSNERPKNFVITGPDGFITIPSENSTFPYDVVVDTYSLQVLIADPLLSKSAFTKLFYFGGIYMEHFNNMFEQRSQTQGNVIVWKVDWDELSAKELNALKEKWGIVKKETETSPLVVETNDTVVADATVTNASE